MLGKRTYGITLGCLGIQFLVLWLSRHYLPEIIYTHFSLKASMPRPKSFILVVWCIYSFPSLFLLLLGSATRIVRIQFLYLAISSYELFHLITVNLLPGAMGHVLWHIPRITLFIALFWIVLKHQRANL